MTKRILIDAVYPDETRVVIHDNNLIQEFDYETASKKKIKHNIYLAKVTRVEPSLQAAFIEYGGDKHGFLSFSEIHPDYFQIPVSDRPTNSSADLKEDASSDEGDIALHLKPIAPPDLSQEENEPELPVRTASTVQDQDDGGLIAVRDELEPGEEISYDSMEEDADSEELPIRRPGNPYKNYKIQEVIKKNQVMLVQVIKEERGNKGASFTSYISLAGRYCVLMPNSDRQGGVSRRIDDSDDRRRLKSIIDSMEVPVGASVIVRTAGAARSTVDIKRDYDYLVRLWNSIREHTLTAKAPAFIHAEGDLIKRTIRDLYNHSIDEVLVQGESAYRTAKDFMKMIMPTHIGKIKQYRSKTPIFCRYQIEDQLSGLYSTNVQLDSGGYIVLNQTEALIAIDVNSGRSTSERNIEETAVKTNLEALYEIARQLRLRDLSGLVVIDFIDMVEQRNRRLIEKSLRSALQHDRAKIQIGSISMFGLMEMSRQRLRPSFIESNTIKCPHCTGKGLVRAPESNAVMILRTIESEIYKGDYETINIFAHPEVVLYMLNFKRTDIGVIEERYNTKIVLHQDNKVSADGFGVEKVKKSNAAKTSQPINVEPVYDDGSVTQEDENYASTVPGEEEGIIKKRWKGSSNTHRKAEPVDATLTEEEFASKSNARSGNRRPTRRPMRRRPEQEAEGTAPVAKAPVLNASSETEARPRRHQSYNKHKKNYRDKSGDAKNVALPAKKEVGLLRGLLKRILD